MIVVSDILTTILTLGFARGITIFPFIFLKGKEDKKDIILLRHERIHLKQQLEMLIIPFYLWYGIEYLIRRFKGYHIRAYYGLSFEQEAYRNQLNKNYKRKLYAWIKYL